ncbi:MAG: hypothetical protein ACI8ZM_002991 [Crocinitomix sp.]|jgi:hypothetical protein
MANCLSYAVNSVSARGAAPPDRNVFLETYWAEYITPVQGESNGPPGADWSGLAGCLNWLINVKGDIANATALISTLTGHGFEWRARGIAYPNPDIEVGNVIVVGNYNGLGGIHFFSRLAGQADYIGIPSAAGGQITSFLVAVNAGNGGQFTQAATGGALMNGIITGWFRSII